MATAGRSIAFSGITVAVGLLVLIVVPVPLVRSIGIGGMLIPAASVAVTLTLLPVLLGAVGQRIDWPRRRRSASASRAWTGWARFIVRHRWSAIVVSLAILGALGAAALNINVGEPSARALATTSPAARTLQTLERADVPAGVLDPIEVLVPSTAAGAATIATVRKAVAAVPRAQVGGPGPLLLDENHTFYDKFPLLIAILAVITILLLARAFGSLVLPVKAVLLNLVSVGATYGVIVLVWQEGHGSHAIWGLSATGAITNWVPLVAFAFLYGLSMDYEVFILTRVREERDRTGSTTSGVVEGIGRTGRLVTSAATILFLALAALTTGPETDVKVMATALGAGILLDATVVRALLVPALVAAIGRWSWWLPSKLSAMLRVPAPLTRETISLASTRERQEMQ